MQRAVCKNCAGPIHFDPISGHWLHAQSNHACKYGTGDTVAEPDES